MFSKLFSLSAIIQLGISFQFPQANYVFRHSKWLATTKDWSTETTDTPRVHTESIPLWTVPEAQNAPIVDNDLKTLQTAVAANNTNAFVNCLRNFPSQYHTNNQTAELFVLFTDTWVNILDERSILHIFDSLGRLGFDCTAHKPQKLVCVKLTDKLSLSNTISHKDVSFMFKCFADCHLQWSSLSTTTQTALMQRLTTAVPYFDHRLLSYLLTSLEKMGMKWSTDMPPACSDAILNTLVHNNDMCEEQYCAHIIFLLSKLDFNIHTASNTVRKTIHHHAQSVLSKHNTLKDHYHIKHVCMTLLGLVSMGVKYVTMSVELQLALQHTLTNTLPRMNTHNVDEMFYV